jgi:hypothetical protein
MSYFYLFYCPAASSKVSEMIYLKKEEKKKLIFKNRVIFAAGFDPAASGLPALSHVALPIQTVDGPPSPFGRTQLSYTKR